MLWVVRGDDRRSWGILVGRFRRPVDPHGRRQRFGTGRPLHESLGMGGVRGQARAVPDREDCRGAVVVDGGRRQIGEPAVVERWTPSFGQVFVTAKVESGFMIQAAFGWPEVGRSPRLRSASSLVYASSGVRPLSDEWGRHRL